MPEPRTAVAGVSTSRKLQYGYGLADEPFAELVRGRADPDAFLRPLSKPPKRPARALGAQAQSCPSSRSAASSSEPE